MARIVMGGESAVCAAAPAGASVTSARRWSRWVAALCPPRWCGKLVERDVVARVIEAEARDRD